MSNEANKPSIADANKAKEELDNATAALEAAKQQLKDAEERHATAKRNFLNTNLISNNSPWNDMYKKLLVYKEEHNGDTLVLTTKNSSAEIKKLAKWVQNQRVQYKYYMNGDTRCFVKEHRIDALNKIGFVWNINEHAWNANFVALEAYHAEHGNFDVPKKHSIKLNTFITNLRKAFRRKKGGILQNELTDERIARLDAINFKWDTKYASRQRGIGENVSFDYLYNLLVNFKETYGHTQVSKMMKEWRDGDNEGPDRKEYKRLPFFLSGVRREHELYMEGKPSALDEEKVRKLTEIGVQWKKSASEARKIRGEKRKISNLGIEAGDSKEAVAIAEVVEGENGRPTKMGCGVGEEVEV